MVARREVELGTLARRALVLAGVVGVTVWLGREAVERLLRPSELPTRTWIDDVEFADADFAARCGPEPKLLVTVVHSPDKTEWMTHAAEAYMQQCKNTHVRLIAREDFAAIDDLEHGELEATAWTPSDTLFLDDFELRLPDAGRERGASLIHTPMVLLVWSDRLAALEQAWPDFEDDPRWLARLACAGTTWSRWSPMQREPGTVPPSSPTAAQLERWGDVDFAHSSPTRTSSGALALLTMAWGHMLETGVDGRSDVDAFERALDLHEPEIEDWLRRCEADFDGPVRTLTHRMLQVGDAGFDGVVTYEHLAQAVLESYAIGEPGTAPVTVVYPRHAYVSDHPILFFAQDEGEGAAARRFAEFLRTPAMQDRAIERGYRPGDLSVDLRSRRVERNPFLELRHYGVRLRLEFEEPPRPGGYGLETLIELWSDATGRY